MGLKDFFKRKPKPNTPPPPVTHSPVTHSPVTHSPNPSTPHSANTSEYTFHDALNSPGFYFTVLPAVWSSPEHRKILVSLFDNKSGKDCMMAILHA